MFKKLLLGLALASLVLTLGCKSTAPTNSTSGTPPTASQTDVSHTTSPPAGTSAPLPALKLESYDGGFFTIKKPAGWNMDTGGDCSTFAFCSSDAANPANQIFYFNEVGPVYLAESQKTVDKNYMDMGGYPVLWYEMPVIDPLTPENFLQSFSLIAETSLAQQFMADFPDFTDVQIISTTDGESPVAGGQTKTIRALFRQGGQLGEGLFYLTVAPVIPLTGMPSGGIGYGFCFAGITAVQSDFKYYEATLTASLNSLNISQDYVNACLKAQQQQFEGLLKAGQTLAETSDIIMGVWDNRSHSEDIIVEKASDAILGTERVYDPDTGTVYEVPLGFYDTYNINRGNYDMNNLQLLPDNDWNLWTAPPMPSTDIH